MINAYMFYKNNYYDSEAEARVQHDCTMPQRK